MTHDFVVFILYGAPRKITFADMRQGGVRGILAYRSDNRSSHSIALSDDDRACDFRLSDIKTRFICKVYGKRGADVQPDFNWKGNDGLLLSAPPKQPFGPTTSLSPLEHCA
jgi:hypothetical protein